MPPKRAKAVKTGPSATAVVAAVPSTVALVQEMPTGAAPLHLPRASGFWRVVGLVLALFQPGMGLLLALFYWNQQDLQARRFGQWCLLLAVIGFFLSNGCSMFNAGMPNGERYIQPF